MSDLSPQAFLAQLAAHLDQQREVITQSWMDAARGNPDIQGAETLAPEELRDHLPHIFDDFLATLRTGGGEQAREESKKDARVHGHYRWEQHYRLDEVLRELNIIRRMILRHGVNPFMRGQTGFTEVHNHKAHDLIERFFEDVEIGSIEQFTHRREDGLRDHGAELRAANAELARVDASRLQLMRTVSHELRNILNGLSSALAVLSVEELESERQKMLSICRNNFADMNSLLEELMNYSALISGQIHRDVTLFDAGMLCEELAINFRSRAEVRGLEFVSRHDPALDEVAGDRRKVKQILANLITNAIKYRRRDAEGGRITMEFSVVDAARWRVAVQDTGIGIAPEDLERVFEEFRRVSENSKSVQGMGLGLAITKRLAELLEGTIHVESEPGRGYALRGDAAASVEVTGVAGGGWQRVTTSPMKKVFPRVRDGRGRFLFACGGDFPFILRKHVPTHGHGQRQRGQLRAVDDAWLPPARRRGPERAAARRAACAGEFNAGRTRRRVAHARALRPRERPGSALPQVQGTAHLLQQADR